MIAVGTLVGLHGYATWRFEPATERGSLQLTRDVIKFIVHRARSAWAGDPGRAGVMDANDDTDFFFPFTKQGFRATMFMLFGAGRLHAA